MKGRLLSLNLLRGLDMVLLVVVGPLQNGWRQSWGVPEWVTHQFSHGWVGFTLWDLIQPLFIFMCGAAVPFALGNLRCQAIEKLGFRRDYAAFCEYVCRIR